jgi:hypothetical protein
MEKGSCRTSKSLIVITQEVIHFMHNNHEFTRNIIKRHVNRPLRRINDVICIFRAIGLIKKTDLAYIYRVVGLAGLGTNTIIDKKDSSLYNLTISVFNLFIDYGPSVSYSMQYILDIFNKDRRIYDIISVLKGCNILIEQNKRYFLR